MNKQQKSEVVKLLQDHFADAQASFLIGYQGLSVSQLQALRKSLREKGGQFKVAKARLMKRAFADTACGEDITPYLKDQIGIVFAGQDAAAVAKALHDFAQGAEQLRIVAGCMENQALSAESVVRIAKLPPKNVLYAQLLGTMNAPSSRLVGMLNLLMVRLLVVLKKAAEKGQ